MAGKLDHNIEDFKEKSKAEGERIVKNVFPKKFAELQEMLESDQFSLTRINKIHCDLNIPIPEPIMLNDLKREGNGEQQSIVGKKRKLEDEDKLNTPGSKVLLLPNGASETNHYLVEMIDAIKPHVVDLIDNANKIKMWITYMVPRIEDGNNFGVSIQEETLSEARQVESEAATYLDQISRYFMTRGKIIAKVAKYPHVTDIRRTVAELDEKEFVSLRLIVHELRNNYVSLHDMIMKNLDKIKKPRNSNAEHIY